MRDKKQWIESKCQEAKHAASKNDFTIAHKIFEINSSLLCEIAHYGKSLISVFLGLIKFSFWRGDWVLG